MTKMDNKDKKNKDHNKTPKKENTRTSKYELRKKNRKTYDKKIL